VEYAEHQRQKAAIAATPKAMAKKVYNRRSYVRRFLRKLGLD
jgi:hypothetical protein